MLPVASTLPEIFAPRSVTTNEVLPPAVRLMFPFIAGILILLVPLLIPEPADIDTHDKLPVPSVCRYWLLEPPVICTLATAPNDTLAVFVKLTKPDALLTVSPVKLPKLVKLEVTTDAFNVVPVKLAALAVIDVLLAAVNWPCPLTVNVATLSPLP